jgi:AcrR family transcriptional regulator
MTRAAAVRAPTRKEQQGAESRRRILDAASSLMGERGFAGTSISEVSRRSGLPASSIYWHFESKEGLLGAVVEEGAQRWFDELPPLPQHGAAESGLDFERFGAVTAAALEKRPEFLRLLFLIALERKHIDKTSLAAIRRVRKLALVRIRKTLVSWLGAQGVAGVEPLADQLSLLVLAVADGAFIQNHVDPRAADVARTFELLHRALGALGRELRTPG